MTPSTDRRGIVTKPVLLVMHGAHSRPGQVGEALAARGIATERCCPRAGDALPENLGAYAGVVVFGGPMSANDDDLPFIRAELDWLPRVIAAGVPFFGICLGAQLLARALGARVSRHPEGLFEIGYVPIAPAAPADGLFPEPLHVYHWHNEGFEVPAGGEALATGAVFPVQAFRYGRRAYGVQFHPEMQEDILRTWCREAAHRLREPGAQPPSAQLAGHAAHGGAMHAWLDGFLDRWLAGDRAFDLAAE